MDINKTIADRRIAERAIPLCFYTQDNLDAFIAAWMVWDKYKSEVQCVAAEPGKMPEIDVLGRDVIILGPLYQKSILLSVADRAATVLWITTPNHLIVPEDDNIKTVKGFCHGLAVTVWNHYYGMASGTPVAPPSLLFTMFNRDFVKFHAAITKKEEHYEPKRSR